MAVTTAVLSGSVSDLTGSADPSVLSSARLFIESNTTDGALLDTAGNKVMVGRESVAVDPSTGAFSHTLVRTDSTDIVPSAGRMYRAHLNYRDTLVNGSTDRKVLTSGWFTLTADAALTSKWTGIETILVPSTANLNDVAMTNVDALDSSAFRVQQDARLSATYGRGIVDARAYGAVLDGTTNDAAAIQAALDTGLDVTVAALPGGASVAAKIGSTLTLNHEGQSLITKDASLRPSFVGDAVQINASGAHADVLITGELQPAGDYTNAAAIRVGGGPTNSYPFSPSVAGSRVFGTIGTPYKGHGIVWEHGPMADFTQAYISDVTRDGIHATDNYIDNNHGNFSTTHVIRAAGVGYLIQNGATEEVSSRHHVFTNAKAYGCGQNFRIETLSNTGSVFSEDGVTPDEFTSTSLGNSIVVIGDAPAYEAWVDNGVGNQLKGYNANQAWDSKTETVRALRIGTTASGDRVLNQTAADTFTDDIQGTNSTVTVTRKNSGSGQRVDAFDSYVALPGGGDRLTVAATYTGTVTVPAATTIAAGATSYFLLETGLGWDNQYLVLVNASTPAAIGGVIYTGFYENPGGQAYVQVDNTTSASQDISGVVIRYVVIRVA